MQFSIFPSEVALQAEYFAVNDVDTRTVAATIILHLMLLVLPVILMLFRERNCKNPCQPVMMIWLMGLAASNLAFLVISSIIHRANPELLATFEYGPVLSLLLRLTVTVVVGCTVLIQNEGKAVGIVSITAILAYMVVEDAIYAGLETRISMSGLSSLVIAGLAAQMSRKLKDSAQLGKLRSAFATKRD